MKRIFSFIILLLIVLPAFAFTCSADDYYVFDAAEFDANVSSSGGMTAANELIQANGTLYYRISTLEDSTAVDRTGFDLKTVNISPEMYVRDYPIIKIGYRSNIAAASAKIDFNVGIKYGGSSTRLWGMRLSYDKTGSDASVIVDLSSAPSGAENVTDYSWNNIDADSPVNYVRIKPYYSKQAMTAGEYFDIEYVAFFKDTAKAEAFDFDYDFSGNYTDLYLTEQVRRMVIGDSVSMNIAYKPTFLAAPQGVTYATSDDTVAAVDANGKVTALSEGTAIITAAHGDFTTECKIYVLKEAVKPVQFYDKDIISETDNVIVSSLGDSITTYAPSPGNGKNYHDWWASWFNLTNEDKGIIGTYLSGTASTAFVNRYTEMRDDADLVTVKGGTNDFAYTSKGTIGNRDVTTYMGGLRTLMEGLIEKYPDRQIVFFTPIKRCEHGQTPENTNNFGDTLGDYAEAVKEIGAVYGIPVIDLYNPEILDFTSPVIYLPGENGNSDTVCESELMPDGLHPSGLGQRIMAKYMLEKLEELNVIDIHTVGDTIEGDVDNIDCKRFSAADLIKSYTNASCVVATNTVKETVDGIAKEFIRITAGESTASTDGTQIVFDLNALGADFLAKDYPHLVIAYRSNIESIGANFGVNLMLKRGGSYTRHWGPKFDIYREETIRYGYISVADKVTGSSMTDPAYTDFDDIDDDSLVKSVYIKPWGGNGGAAMSASDYADIEFIAFFKSQNDAALYVQNEQNKTSSSSALAGDVDGNGAVEANDSVVLSRYLAGWSGYADLVALANANVDSADGTDANDSVILSRFLAGWSGYETLPYNG